MATLMTNKFNSEVNERRLRPIYDALDTGNKKQALNIADKLLKKQKNNLTAKALKAVALWRCGKHDISLATADEVVDAEPVDESTLQALGICFKEMGRHDMIAKIYEVAVKKSPENEDFQAQLFMAYVRLHEYKKQQQVAMMLWKMHRKTPYFFWAVMSVVMQSVESSCDEDLASKMLLPLAERMITKHIANGDIELGGEAHLYLIILERQANYQVALDALSGKLSRCFVAEPSFKEETTARYLVELQQWKEAQQVYLALLSKNPDSWLYWSGLIDCCFNAGNGKHLHNGDVGDHRNCFTETASHVVREKILAEQANEGHRRCRGPYLARFYLIKQSAARGLPLEEFGAVEELLADYARMFADKPCCYSDLEPYLHLVHATRIQTFLQSISDPSYLDENMHLDMRATYRYIFYLTVTRWFSVPLPRTSDQLVHLYKQMTTEVQVSEQQYADDLLLLAAHCYLDDFEDSGDLVYLCKAINTLEDGVAISPANFQFCFLLARCYTRLGAVKSVMQHIDSLEIKHIELDSIGYFLTSVMQPFGHYTAAWARYTKISKTLTNSHRESIEHVISAYKFGSFTKVLEFVTFRRRLLGSLHHAKITTEKCHLEQVLLSDCCDVIAGCHDHPERNDLRDNRDLEIMTEWRPESTRSSNPITQEISLLQELAWLRLRDLELRLLRCAYSEETEPFTAVLAELGRFVDGLDGKYKLQFDIRGPPNTMIRHFLSHGHQSAIIAVFKLHLTLLNSCQGDADEVAALCKELEGSMAEQLQHCQLKINEMKPRPLLEQVPQSLLQCCLTIETVSIVTLVVEMMMRLCQGGKTAKKKKQKGSQRMTSKQITGRVRQLCENLKHITELLDDVVQSFDVSEWSTSEIAPTETEVKYDPAILLTWERVIPSYRQSTVEMHELLVKRISQLSRILRGSAS